MIFQVCAVRDRVVDAFNSPFVVTSVGQAIRTFGDEVNRKQEDNPLSKHPEDFDLYKLGTWDSESGLFDCGVPKQVAVGKDLVRE